LADTSLVLESLEKVVGVYVRPFKKEDLSAFKPIEPMVRNREVDFKLAQAIEDSGLSITGIRDGEIFGCGGVHPLEEGQGELWLRLAKNCLKHKLETLRWLREGLKVIEEIYPFRQLNAVIRCDFEPSIKLIKFLGFHLTRITEHEGNKWFTFSKRVKE